MWHLGLIYAVTTDEIHMQFSSSSTSSSNSNSDYSRAPSKECEIESLNQYWRTRF
jgi:hypothetical protein